MPHSITAWLTAVLVCAAAPGVRAADGTHAIVVQDRAALRAAPRDSAQQLAVLWQGELMEVRSERMDYVQVYDHKRERGGFVRASELRRSLLNAAEAPELMSVIRFVRETTGAEALGIGLVAAYLQAAPAEVLNGPAGIEALDALGMLADRLAQRASTGAVLGKNAQTALAAHLEVAVRYGVKFNSYERNGRMQICYDGDAFRRMLGMRSGPEQRARAALALTREECVAPDLPLTELRRLEEWVAEILDKAETGALPSYLRNRMAMRRATVWSSLAYHQARRGLSAEALASRALAELTTVNRSELTDSDIVAYNSAATRVGAARWAALPAATTTTGLRVETRTGQPGETCLLLIDNAHVAENPLARRCTYAIVWTGSQKPNREGTALAIAVQPTATWLELWIFRKDGPNWSINVLPPAVTTPDCGYVELAGWVAGGKRLLIARESRSEGRYRRSFELLRLDTLAVERQSGDPANLDAFQRWQDAEWKRRTLSLR